MPGGETTKILLERLTEAEARVALETFTDALDSSSTPSHRRRKLESLRNKFENAMRAFIAGKLERQREGHDARVKREARELLAEGRSDSGVGLGDGDDSSMPDSRTH